MAKRQRLNKRIAVLLGVIVAVVGIFAFVMYVSGRGQMTPEEAYAKAEGLLAEEDYKNAVRLFDDAARRSKKADYYIKLADTLVCILQYPIYVGSDKFLCFFIFSSLLTLDLPIKTLP